MAKDTTQKIKGVAILIMIFHHFIVYGYGVEFPRIISMLGHQAKICVGIYAVLSGYGYYFAKEKTIQYGLKKSWGLLQEYWASLFTIFVPCALLGGWIPTGKEVVINLFALGPNLNWNAWYVHFFIFCMLVMPIVSKILRFAPVINVGFAISVPYVLEVAIHELIPNYQEITMMQVLFNCMLYFGVFLAGYLMAKYDVITKVKTHWAVGLLLMAGALGLRIALRHLNTFGFNMDVIYAPLFVLGAANLFESLKGKWVEIFSTFGKYSTGMWFIHAIFFATYTKDYFQPIMMVVKWPPLMYVWLVVMSLAGAWFFRKCLDLFNMIPMHRKRVS